MNKKSILALALLLLQTKVYASVQARGGVQTIPGTGTPLIVPDKADIGYIITNDSTPADLKVCTDVQRCKKQCDANAVPKGSKVPCKSKIYPLSQLCYEACDQVGGALSARKQDSNTGPLKLPLYMWCSTYINCMKYMMGTKGWPFRCANIYCAFTDPEDKDTKTRNLAEFEKIDAQSLTYDNQEALPEGFIDAAGSEF